MAGPLFLTATVFLLLLLPCLSRSQGERRAVVIGVGGYSFGYSALDYTARDARRVTSALEDLGYSVTLLAAHAKAGEVNYQDVLKALRVAAAKSEPGDTLLFYFAGHGSRRNNKDYLLLSDSDPDHFDTTAMSLETLSEIVAQSKASQRIFVIDACRKSSRDTGKSGFTDGKLDPGFKDTLDRLAQKSGPDQKVKAAILYACSPGQASQESVTEKAGVFSERFIQALEGGAEWQESVTLGKVLNFVRAGMPAESAGKQTPLLSGLEALELRPSTLAHARAGAAGGNPGGPAGKIGKATGIGGGHYYEGGRPAKPAAGDIWINPKDGAEMVWIPAGEFLNGEHGASWAYKVYLDGYYIARNLVTVGQYKKFCEANLLHMPPAPAWGWKDDHPIENVTWFEAVAYGKWAFGDDKMHLPTSAQWDKAARGTDGRIFPWGDTFDIHRFAHSKANFGDEEATAPVGSFPNGASPYGILDMTGNVWQWCSDWGGPMKNPYRNPTGPTEGGQKVLRGCFYLNNPATTHIAMGLGHGPAGWVPYSGFRCAIWEIPQE